SCRTPQVSLPEAPSRGAVDDEAIGPADRGRDEFRVALVGRRDPRAGLMRALAELDMTRDEALGSDGFLARDEPHGGHGAARSLPMRFVEQQIVALGDY